MKKVAIMQDLIEKVLYSQSSAENDYLHGDEICFSSKNVVFICDVTRYKARKLVLKCRNCKKETDLKTEPKTYKRNQIMLLPSTTKNAIKEATEILIKEANNERGNFKGD